MALSTTEFLSLLFGLLGFITAIATIFFTSRHNSNSLRLQQNKEEWERKKAYNHVFGRFLNLYHSYVKHKFLFDDEGVEILHDDILIKSVDLIDNFQNEVNKFRNVVDKETEIIPELSLLIHELLDLLSRFELIGSMIPINVEDPNSLKSKLMFQRAHIYAVSELLDEYFIDLIEVFSKRLDIDKEFKNLLTEFNSPDSKEKNIEIQKEILTRMMRSLSKQLGQEVNLNDFME